MFEDILVESSDRLRGTEEPEGHSVDLGAAGGLDGGVGSGASVRAPAVVAECWI